jgi:protein-S-isoprenylcysteine O-methyltransferase Ste14
MYTAFYLILAGFALLTSNWLLGGGMLAGLTLVMISRFGDRYREYMARTGRSLTHL